MSEEQTETQGTGTEGGAEAKPEDTNTKLANVLDKFSAKLSTLEQTQMQIANALKPAVQQETRPQLTKEQTEALAKDPNLQMQFIDGLVRQGTQKIEVQAQKTVWDNKAYAEFPAMNTNEEFRQKVLGKMNELTNSGEYHRDSPMLIYRAAQLAAVGLPQPKTTTERAERPTSEGTNRAQPRTTQKIGDSDPRMEFLKLMEPSMDPKKVEKFRSSLEPYVAPEKGKSGRVLTRGR